MTESDEKYKSTKQKIEESKQRTYKELEALKQKLKDDLKLVGKIQNSEETNHKGTENGKETAQNLFDQILGMTPTRITLGHGSFITIDFGRDIRKEYQTRSGLKTRCFGEWHLWVYMCAWRIDKGGKPLIGADDRREKIEQALSEIKLKALNQVIILNEAFDASFHFGDDIQLHLFSYNVQEGHEQWMFFTPGDKVFTAGFGIEWSVELK